MLKADDIVKSLGYKASDFPEGLLDAGKYNGGQYAVPWSVTPLGLYVNKDVLKSAGVDSIPTDKAGYLAALDKLKAAGVQGEWVDGYVFTGTFEFESLLWQFGGDLFDKDVTKATFNSEAGVKALTWMTDLIKKGYSPADVAQDGNINALIAGKTAFNWNGVWQTTNTAFDKLQWEATAVPQIGDQKAVWSSSTHWMFMNNKGQDKNKTAAAATFVKWMNDNSADWPKTGELPAKSADRHGMAHDAKRDRLLLFSDAGPKAGDVAAYDLKSGVARWLGPAGATAALAHCREAVYVPHADWVLTGGRVKGEDGGWRWLAYDCAANAWVAFDLGGDDPVGKPGAFNNSMGLMYDPTRKLVWAVGQRSEVYALRLDRSTVKVTPLK